MVIENCGRYLYRHLFGLNTKEERKCSHQAELQGVAEKIETRLKAHPNSASQTRQNILNVLTFKQFTLETYGFLDLRLAGRGGTIFHTLESIFSIQQ